MSQPANPVNELPDNALDALIERERARLVAPVTSWASLSAQLRAEGVIRDDSHSASHRPGRRLSYHAVARPPHMSWKRRAGQMAVGAVLAAVGFIAGRGTGPVAPDSESTSASVATEAVALDAAPTFASLDDARTAMAQSQAQWQQAVNYLAANDSSQLVIASPDEFHGRLQTLDQMMQIMQAALQEAPTDPIINQYYLSTFGARQATVQQLNQALPVGARLAGF